MRRRYGVMMGMAVLSGLLATSTARADGSDGVEWKPEWHRVGIPEAAAIVGVTIADTEIDQRIPYPTHADWHGGIVFDDWARGVFHGRTLAVQSTASTVSDWMYKAGALVPFVVDDYVAALSIHQNPELALQMAFIGLEAYAVSGIVSLTAEHAVGRQRPYAAHCDERDPSGQLLRVCGTADDDRSFYSGHATATATTAGLVCIEHQRLPLFGGGLADLAPCVLMIGVSVSAGLLRLVYDEHWASDVITGWAVGAASGYLLPALLHYGFHDGRPPGEIASGDLRAVPTLLPYAGGAGAGLVGVF
jgi:membrane-associated phospholipid phosphatase